MLSGPLRRAFTGSSFGWSVFSSRSTVKAFPDVPIRIEARDTSPPKPRITKLQAQAAKVSASPALAVAAAIQAARARRQPRTNPSTNR
jgi:hypothetical protein